MKKNLKKKKKGFTLVEVIIVLAIIAIIAAIAIPNLTKVREDSKNKADTASAEIIARTFETMLTDGTFVPNGETIISVKCSGSSKTYTYSVNPTKKPDDAVLNEYFKRVDAPQQKDINTYVIKVDADEIVTVQASTKTP